ncbi:tripartite tricarboxylate transporter substrate binding protein [Paenibacillus hamazuiensis]|uniref:tripartite tricarboxylate transporter substrate binding protein n=1 Tax=Paenibacillus hamazuiensis TaxID=2936508 RepID=UPI00200EF9A2|nr:tripartite tricarboxylate transporter substrate binding protein [Paenibacillus hamazuiensis]
MKKKGFVSLLAVALLTVTMLSGCAAPAAKGSAGNAAAAKKEDPKYPTKPIDYVVSFGAGGGNDIIARAVAEYLSKEWGQPINVVNKAGAGGAIGVNEALKHSKPDGYTVLGTSVTNTSTLLAGTVTLPFTIADFQFVSKVVEDPLAFIVKEDAPWKDFKEFSDWAKNNTDQLTYATPGPSGIATFAISEWLDLIGADFSKARMITTVGASESMPKIAGGHITVGVLSVSEAATMVKAGKAKMLAVVSGKRSQYFPDVPTADESGIKMTVKWWTGVAVPVGTPDSIVKKWDEAIAKMSKDPAFLEKLKSINAESSYLSTAEVTKMVKEETEKYVEVATKKGLRK